MSDLPSLSLPVRLRHWLAATAALVLPLVLALLLIRLGPVAPAVPSSVSLERLSPGSAEALARLFRERDYHWPPQRPVPRLGVTHLPDGLAELPVDSRKALFFRTLLPLVLAENRRLRAQSSFVHDALAKGAFSGKTEMGRRLRQIAREFKVTGDLSTPAVQELLIRRVDVVPVGLALAQAATESGWGTSRFAREANNLFGVWTYDADAGMMPKRRRKNAHHYVRVYPDLRSSVQSYLHNINVGHAYLTLRRMRYQLRQDGLPLDPIYLARGLHGYSERGKAYVHDIQQMIRGNGLNKLDNLLLRPAQRAD